MMGKREHKDSRSHRLCMTAVKQCYGHKTVVFMNSQQLGHHAEYLYKFKAGKISAWSLRRWVPLSEDLFAVETA